MKINNKLLQLAVLGFLIVAVAANVAAYNPPSSNKIWYHLNESSSPAHDYSGNGNDGTWTGITSGVPGVSKSQGTWGSPITAYDYSGSAYTHTSYSQDPPVTVSLWANMKSNTDGQVFFGNDNNWQSSGYSMKWDSNNYLQFILAYCGTHVLNKNVGLQGAGYTHIVATLDSSSNWQVYVNGSRVGSGSYSCSGYNAGSQGFYTGAGGSSNTKFDGFEDEIHIYNKILSSSEINNLYNYNNIIGNNPPSIDSVSTSPSSWTLGSNVNVSANASDSDGTVSSVTANVWENGTQIVSDASLTNKSGTWKIDNLFKVDKLDVYYNYTLTATDNNGATDTYSDSQLISDNQEFSIIKPENRAYGSSTVNWKVKTNSTDDVLGETLDLEIKSDGTVKDAATVIEGDTATGSFSESDGNHTLEVTLTEQDGNTRTKKRFYEIDTTPPKINVTAPTGDLDRKKNLYLNYTVKDPNLDSSTCEYSKDGSTTFSISNCQNTTVTFNKIGEHTIMVSASDTANNTGNTTVNFTTDYENRINLEDASSGSAIQDFEVSFTNGTAGAGGSTTNGQFKILTSKLPYGTTNMTLKSSGYKIRNETFSIDDSFELQDTFQMERAGFSIDAKDEQTQSDIQFNFTARNKTTSFNKTDITQFQKDYKDFDSIGFPTGDVTVTVEKKGYKTRKYFASINQNSVISLKPYLLKKGQGIYVSIETYSPNGDALPGSILTIQKQVDGSYQQIAQDKTGTTGGSSFYLDPNVQYRVVASKTGYSSFQGTFNPANYQYNALKIYLGSKSANKFSTILNTVEYDLKPDEKIISGNQTFNFTVYDSESQLSEFGLRIKNSSGSVLDSKTITTSPSGGSVTINFNLSNTSGSKIDAEGFFVKNSEMYSFTNNYRILKPLNSGEYSLINTKRYLEKKLSIQARSILSILLVMAVTLPVSKSKRFSSSGAGIIALMVLGICTWANFFPGEIYVLTFLPVAGIYLMQNR